MIEGLIILASYGFYGGGTIGNFLQTWKDLGVFDYLLPFTAIFALVFVILNGIKIFKDNRTVNAILALVVGLMALQFDFVPIFFSEVFPRLGIGLGIILVILIMIGLFIDPKKPGLMYGLLGIAAIVGVVLLLNTANSLGWAAAYAWRDHLEEIITAIIFIIIIGTVVGVTNKDSKEVKMLGFRDS